MTDVVEQARQLMRTRDRVVLGIVGPPGAGKSTLAEGLVTELGGDTAVLLPMDGFHLAQAELRRLGRAERKGAPDTFDALGYAAVLRRVHAADDDVVYAPSFDRRIGEPVAGSIAVEPSVRVVLTEGNYLLDDADPWQRARAELDEAWYVDTDDDVRRRRLIDRHVEFGKSADDARRWVAAVDDVNAARVVAAKHRADLRVPGR